MATRNANSINHIAPFLNLGRLKEKTLISVLCHVSEVDYRNTRFKTHPGKTVMVKQVPQVRVQFPAYFFEVSGPGKMTGYVGPARVVQR